MIFWFSAPWRPPHWRCRCSPRSSSCTAPPDPRPLSRCCNGYHTLGNLQRNGRIRSHSQNMFSISKAVDKAWQAVMPLASTEDNNFVFNLSIKLFWILSMPRICFSSQRKTPLKEYGHKLTVQTGKTCLPSSAFSPSAMSSSSSPWWSFRSWSFKEIPFIDGPCTVPLVYF